MIKKFFKKMVGIRNDEESKLAESLRNNANKIQEITEEKIGLIKKEYNLIREKLDNLSETNYQQGLKYLAKGDIRDAILRFRIVIKFWPEQYPDAYYQLAYSLILHNKPGKAEIVLKHLLRDHPAYSHKAYELLEKIKKSPIDAA